MGTFFSMAEIQAVLFMYFLVGMFARRRNILTGESISSLVDFLIKIALPCMIFDSFTQDLTLSKLTLAAEGLVVAVAVNLFSLLLGKVLYRGYPREKKSILQYGTLVSNAGFAGFPLVSAAFGQEALFYASIFLIPTRVVMWTAGIGLFTGESGKGSAKAILLNPGIVAVEVGLLRMALGVHLPGAINTVVQTIGDAASPLSMIVIGAMLAHIDLRKVAEKSVLYLSAVRLLLIPLLLLLVLKLLGVDDLLTATAVCLIGMPVGVNTALLAQKYGADPQYASRCVFVSTVLSLVTVPVLTLLL